MAETPGIHHVTAIAGDPRQNVAFHTEVLGLRLVKKTVNFDSPGTYHLYYGDEIGTPGTILTFFPVGEGSQGTVGRGQTSATAYVVPEDSLDFWREHLESHGVTVAAQTKRFGARVLSFSDPDGQPYELLEAASDIEPWADGPIPTEYAIRGFYGVTLDSLQPEQTGKILEALGYEQTATEGERTRYQTTDQRTEFETDGARAGVVDVLARPDGTPGREGPGTVHHVAFRTADDETQTELSERLKELGQNVTPQKDRQYFRSVYFREPGGVLFEIATDVPGFDRDETVSELGTSLKLPPWLEARREQIEQQLPSLSPEQEGSS